MARAKAVLESVPEPPAQRAPKRRRPSRQKQGYRRRDGPTGRPIDLWSVLKVSICFYLCALIVMLLAGIMLWWIASAAGVVGNVEHLVGELVSNKKNGFHFLSWEVLRAATLIGLVMV